jgi:hypothetical protein
VAARRAPIPPPYAWKEVREYDQGYSLDRLHELVQVKLASPRARNGTHLCGSLAVLFRLVDTRPRVRFT